MKKNKKKIVYKNSDSSDEDMPSGKLTVVPDFLPPPEALMPPQVKTVKITIELEEGSVRFFKEKAKQNRTKYQRMIRSVLNKYASHYSQN